MESSGSRGRNAFLTTAGVLAALAIVAVAARGSISAGEGGSRKPSQALVDVLLGIYVLGLVGGAALFVWLLVLRRNMRVQAGKAPRRTFLEMLLTSLVLVGFAILMAERLNRWRIRPAPPPDEGLVPQVGTVPLTGVTGAEDPAAATGFSWLPALATVALVVVALAAWWFAGRARKRARGELRPVLARAVGRAVEESLDDLRAEPDPRRAVIAAYARLERVLAAHNVPRQPAEAPLEYLARLLTELSVGDRAARDLTDLFERAKFSHHAVGPEMKEQAIAALESVRDDLAAARALEEKARLTAAGAAAR